MKKPTRKSERQLRQAIIDKCRWMNVEGLNQGTSGNISARLGDTLLITPTAIPYEMMRPEMIAAMPIDGDYGSWDGPLKPSSEWRFHLDIMRARPDVGAIVHTHSTYATIIAITRREIPACHYMIAAFGGSTIRCAPYARYGTKELSTYAVEALRDRMGCLLGSHGMIALGERLDKAMWARRRTGDARQAILPFAADRRTDDPHRRADRRDGGRDAGLWLRPAAEGHQHKAPVVSRPLSGRLPPSLAQL